MTGHGCVRGIGLAILVVWAAQIAAMRCAAGEKAEFFILWGDQGRWDGSLEVRDGRLLKVEPYSLDTEYGDALEAVDERRASWRSGTGGQMDGVQVTASVTPKTVFHFRTVGCSRDLKWSDFSAEADRLVLIEGKSRFLVLGCGSPERGPRFPPSIPLPKLFQSPQPADPVLLPDDCGKTDQPIIIKLTQAAPGPLAARRVSKGDGRLYLEIHSNAGPLAGQAQVEFSEDQIAAPSLKGSLWLSLRPRVGTVKITVSQPGAAEVVTLTAPMTLVETRGPKLYLNGEVFLVKGSLPRDLNDADAEYLKSLCANTIRIGTQNLGYLDKYGFMGIVMTGKWPPRFCETAETEAEFRDILAKCEEGHLERCRQTAANPRALIIQHANEQVFGGDPWAGRMGRCTFDRLDYVLAVSYNLAKPLDPMLPNGYSNCCLVYRAPDFLDIYLHNTYLDKDRKWPPLEEFMRLQGCDRRPYVHTEFGANVYMPQANVGGKNTPLLEKIHAWNYPNRWREYLGAGTMGGTNYCFYDYDYAKFEKVLKEDPEKLQDFWDKGFTNFGVMTFDRKPKLACWELWHLWRDFEVAPKKGNEGQALRIRYVRDYRASDCRLTLRTDAGEEVVKLDDFAAKSEREATLRAPASTFRWRMDYTTHAGLSMVACGAYPPAAEAEDFLACLKDRETFPFLRELLDAEVLRADGRTDATTLKDMEREDGIVPIVFRKPNGVVYVTVLARKRPKGDYVEGVTLDVAFRGRVEAVDEMTGKPTDARPEVEPLPNGLRLKNVRVPFIPSGYGARLQRPLSMPAFRITP